MIIAAMSESLLCEGEQILKLQLARSVRLPLQLSNWPDGANQPRGWSRQYLWIENWNIIQQLFISLKSTWYVYWSHFYKHFFHNLHHVGLPAQYFLSSSYNFSRNSHFSVFSRKLTIWILIFNRNKLYFNFLNIYMNDEWKCRLFSEIWNDI